MSDRNSTQVVQTILEEAGLSLDGQDFDAVVRLYQRFAGQRTLLAARETGETEPMLIAVFHPGGNQTHERR